MARLLLLIAIVAVLYMTFRRVQSLPPRKRRAGMIQFGFVLLICIVVALLLAGKIHWIGAALAGLLVVARQFLPVVIRYFPALASLFRRKASATTDGQQSTLQTATLKMTLDHGSGRIDGEILIGPYQGWLLSELDRQQLDELRQYCQQNDGDSLQLLESFVAQSGAETHGQQQSSQDQSGTADGAMTESEALAILGLEAGASQEDIVAAHRKLMQKIHPDRGGNDYLAAKINQAKEHLLG